MNKPLEIFCEVPCLTEKSSPLNGAALQKKWFKAADKRIIGQYLQKFISYNLELFNFVGTNPFISGTDQNIALGFKTSQFIGVIPLRSADTGKQIGDFIVTPRFSGKNRYEDYIEVLNLLGNDISPEVTNSLPLTSGRNFRPPLYLEALKFINLLDSLVKRQWRKFDRIEKVIEEPRGKINWKKYIQNEYKVENRIRYPVAKNLLSEFHSEYSQIRYVFDLCKQELSSSNTPYKTKLQNKYKLEFLEERLYNHLPLKTDLIQIRFSDAPLVKSCKFHANKILNYNLKDSVAWRVDFSDVFEKFVQFVFMEVAKEFGGRLLPNYKFKGYSKKANSWELSHVEPDAILQKEHFIIFIDAKYKSHLYNKYGTGETLKDDHRHDLHQIIAYTSFDTAKSKLGILCYPAENVEIKEIKYLNPINQTNVKVKIFGLPFKRDIIREAVRLLINELSNLD